MTRAGTCFRIQPCDPAVEGIFGRHITGVMAGLDPAIHPLREKLDRRVKPGDDAANVEGLRVSKPLYSRSESLPSLNPFVNHKTYPRPLRRAYCRRVRSNRGRCHETSFQRDRMRPLRARLVTSHSGGSGLRSGTTTGALRGARCTGPATPQGEGGLPETRPELGAGPIVSTRSANAAVERREADAPIARCVHASKGREVKEAPLGAPLPHML
jgi:hypothetical protein